MTGGLDSTHALLVVARAMDRMGRPRSDILAYTMPGFATTEHTKSNAIALAEAVGASIETIDIRPAATGAARAASTTPSATGEPVYDITFENVQAGVRTDFLFRLANQHGGIVIGTSDLSELALGWATYGVGDQMSHYAVNTGVPKTLIQHVIRWVISAPGGRRRRPRRRCCSRCSTPRSPPSSCPPARTARSVAQRTGSARTRCTTSRCSTCSATGTGRRRSRSSRSTPGGRGCRRLAARVPRGDHYAYDLPRSRVAAGVPSPLLRVRAVQALGDPQRPEGRRPAARCRRAATGGAPSDGNARVWLAELKAALPELVADD